MKNTKNIIDQAVKIQNGSLLSLSDINDLVASLILEACTKEDIRESALRIANNKFSYELSQLETEKDRLTNRLLNSNAPVSPLDL
tara:strand:- start:1612 stop:1866 length:255 start_codon:yes stop_codon:yes gene_type:complete